MPTEINLHKQQLTKISDEILVNRPVLEKITVFDQIIIDSNYLKKITILSEKWCPEIYQEKEFLRFALIYINCVKYHQYQCCVPPVLEIVSESIFEFDKKKNKTVFDKVMYCLLNKEGITKRNISLNGYTHLDLNFPKTVSLFKEDKELNRFLSEESTS